jgi:hypothetical protein
VLAFGLAVAAAVRGLRGPDPFWRTVALGALGALVAVGFHSAFDNIYVHGVSVQVGALMGLAQVAADHARFGQPPAAPAVDAVPPRLGALVFGSPRGAQGQHR